MKKEYLRNFQNIEDFRAKYHDVNLPFPASITFTDFSGVTHTLMYNDVLKFKWIEKYINCDGATDEEGTNVILQYVGDGLFGYLQGDNLSALTKVPFVAPVVITYEHDCSADTSTTYVDNNTVTIVDDVEIMTVGEKYYALFEGLYCDITEIKDNLTQETIKDYVFFSSFNDDTVSYSEEKVLSGGEYYEPWVSLTSGVTETTINTIIDENNERYHYVGFDTIFYNVKQVLYRWRKESDGSIWYGTNRFPTALLNQRIEPIE